MSHVSVDPLAWVALAVAVAVLVAVDLLTLRSDRGGVHLRQAGLLSVLWLLLGLGFAGVVCAWFGADPAGAYLAGYLVERSLSVDNVFVLALVVASFGVPASLQGRVLAWGVIGALVLRVGMILAGAALLDAVHWAVYLFGALLVVTGVHLARHRGADAGPGGETVLRVVRRVVPVSRDFAGARYLVREDGRLRATPLLAALLAVAVSDVIFAVDSIPAIFAITRDPFVVIAANAFALLGLRALYFLLAGSLRRFPHLQAGLAAVLVLVGAKMLAADVVEVPIWLSLLAIALIVGGSIAVSLVRPPRRPAVGS